MPDEPTKVPRAAAKQSFDAEAKTVRIDLLSKSATVSEQATSTQSKTVRPPQLDTLQLEADQTIAQRYRIIKELGKGAQAKVFKVRDLELDEEVALKVLTRQLATHDDEATEQFKQEIRLARRIVHQNVCRIYDFGRCGDLQFVTMELVQGGTLAEQIRANSFRDLDQRLAIFRDVLIGVRAAHAIGIVHRDIKPLNIMVTGEGRAVVMDFGLAGEAEKVAAGEEGSLLGTPAYIAPERLLGETADHRSDIYSLGILLFEITTGQLPFSGDLQQLVDQHLHQQPPRPREVNSRLPESMDRAVAKMLAKSPEDRYTTVDEVLQVLAEIRSTPVGQTVLLAEGDEDLRCLISHHLSLQGLSIQPAKDGEETIELLLREKPDMIVLDVEMPKIDGLRIAEMIRHYQHVADVPVFMLSRVMDSSYMAYSKQLGITKLVKRPFAVRDFAREIKELMEANQDG
jgi:serine/threonine protein kinase